MQENLLDLDVEFRPGIEMLDGKCGAPSLDTGCTSDLFFGNGSWCDRFL